MPGMFYLRLRKAGEQVNYERIECLYAAAWLQVKRRKRKKVLTFERKPLGRPCAAKKLWSMDFVFDRKVEGRVIKNFAVVDNASHEAVNIVPKRAIGGLSLTRILDQLALQCELLVAIVRIMTRIFAGAPYFRGGIYVVLPCF